MSPDVPEDRGGFPSGMETQSFDYVRRIYLFRDDEVFDLARGRELRQYNACAYGVWIARIEIDDNDDEEIVYLKSAFSAGFFLQSEWKKLSPR